MRKTDEARFRMELPFSFQSFQVRPQRSLNQFANLDAVERRANFDAPEQISRDHHIELLLVWYAFHCGCHFLDN